MKTRFLSFLLIFLFGVVFSQQNEEFKQVREYYNHHRNLLKREFKKKYDSEQKEEAKQSVMKDFGLFMSKMDSVENFALVSALITVKNREDLSKIARNNISTKQNIDLQDKKDDDTKGFIDAEYPGGMNTLQEQVSELLYTSDINQDLGMVKTTVTFIVEKDGNITFVKAFGDNSTFNRQAEIAVYLLPNKFSPAYVNNIPVRYKYKLPLSINFD